MDQKFCMGCMREIPAMEKVCPVCGYRHEKDVNLLYALKCGTILNGKYLVGKVIGQGGFGITYVGRDLQLGRKVALKEYYPIGSGAVSRNTNVSSEVTWNPGVGDGWEHGYDGFLQEAWKMSTLESIPGIVGVKDVFRENRTAYIVMDFVEGKTLKAYVKEHGLMTFEECTMALLPIMEALAKVHDTGIIHRDVSPDNLMLCEDGTIWLLDLGAAKQIDLKTQVVTSIKNTEKLAKHGFSPLEQYMNSGNIGPWTDVYSICATIYYCTTGKVPPSVMERYGKDTLKRVHPLTQAQFDFLKAGMAIQPKDRPWNMKNLLEYLRMLIEPAAPNRSGPEAAGVYSREDKQKMDLLRDTAPIQEKTLPAGTGGAEQHRRTTTGRTAARPVTEVVEDPDWSDIDYEMPRGTSEWIWWTAAAIVTAAVGAALILVLG